MPFLKTPKTSPSRSSLLESSARKCGLRSSVFSLSGDEFRGEWLDDRRHGHGTQVWKNAGALYQGGWKSGRRDGFGTYSVEASGRKYERQYVGQWRRGQKHGHGTFYYSDGSFYEGGWSEDQRSGPGSLYQEDFIYQGQWLKDTFHGDGRLLLPNGNSYEGSWRDGEKSGPGKFFYADTGLVYEGFWSKGAPKCGTISSDPGDPPSTRKFPLPEVQLVDANEVLQEAKSVWTSAGDGSEPSTGGVAQSGP